MRQAPGARRNSNGFADTVRLTGSSTCARWTLFWRSWIEPDERLMPKFLFLQGVASPFFSRLADWLIAKGCEVFRINFCVGDAIYWRGKLAWNFRQRVESLPAFMQEHC